MGDSTPCNVVVLYTRDVEPRGLNLDAVIGRVGCSIRYVCVDSSTAEAPEDIDCERFAGDVDWATTLVVLITATASHTLCVDWIIQYSQRSNKRVVGIWASGAERSLMPNGLDNHADAVVPAQSGNLVQAVCGGFDGWEHPDGTPYEPREINRHCR
jgi:hypothetical protein